MKNLMSEKKKIKDIRNLFRLKKELNETAVKDNSYINKVIIILNTIVTLIKV